MLDLWERSLVLGMHIPDGFLSFSVPALFWIVTIVCLNLAVRRTSHELNDRQVPLVASGTAQAQLVIGAMA